MKRPAMLLMVLFLAAACRQPEGGKGAAVEETTARVKSVELAPRPLADSHEIPGTFETKRRSALEAKVSGRIESLPVQLGQAVKAGELLGTLDARDFQARLDQARAARDQAQNDLRRVTGLSAQRAATPAELEAAQTRERGAAAAAREAETMLDYAELRAPFAGVVARKTAEVGDLAGPGRPVLELEDPATLRFVALVPNALLGRLRPGLPVTVRLADGARSLSGSVGPVAPSADPLARTARVEVEVAGPDLRAGVFGRLLIPGEERPALILPAGALVHRGQMDIAFVAKDGRAELRLVKLGRAAEGGFEVLSGLEARDRVITEGAENLRDGQPLLLE